MDEINVIVISSVRPEKSTAAAVTLYRHLVNRHGIQLHVLPAEYHEIVHGSFHSKIIPRLLRTSARRWAGDIDYLMHTTLPLEKRLIAPPARLRTVVLTLAYRSGCWVAQRYAKRHGLPLIVRFDDWWPDIAGVHAAVRKQLERHFLELHRSDADRRRSDLASPSCPSVFPPQRRRWLSIPVKALRRRRWPRDAGR